MSRARANNAIQTDVMTIRPEALFTSNLTHHGEIHPTTKPNGMSS